MILIRRRKELETNFNPASLRDQLCSHFPEAVFDSEEQTSKRLRLMKTLPNGKKTPQFVLDHTARDGQAYGPTYAFEFDADGIRVHGNVRGVDAVFLMDDMPSKAYWDRMVSFAESIDGGVVTAQETG